MYDIDIYEVNSIDEANDIGHDMGCTVQDVYEIQIGDFYSEPDWAVIEITDTETPLEEIQKACCNLSFCDFIEKHCKK